MKLIKYKFTFLVALLAFSFWPLSPSSGSEMDIASDNAPMLDDVFRKNIQQAFRSLDTVGSVGIPAIVRRESIQTEDAVPDIAQKGAVIYLVRLVTLNGEIRALALANEDASKIRWILLPPSQNPGS